MSAQTAAKFFDAVCLRTAPSYARAEETLLVNGFAMNPETGTFYHPTFDLSFHVEDRCSMVFASDVPPGDLGLVFGMAATVAGGEGDIGINPDDGFATASGPAGTRMTFEPFTAPSGGSYFRALLAPDR